jgi:hypothetical protein
MASSFPDFSLDSLDLHDIRNISAPGASTAARLPPAGLDIDDISQEAGAIDETTFFRKEGRDIQPCPSARSPAGGGAAGITLSAFFSADENPTNPP